LPPDIYLLGLLLALGSTVLPVLLFGEAVARIGAARTSALSMVGPVATLTMGWIFRGEPISGVQAGGALLVILGVWRIANR
jgi:drug/metabolite transporter (DMT)-like permease